MTQFTIPSMAKRVFGVGSVHDRPAYLRSSVLEMLSCIAGFVVQLTEPSYKIASRCAVLVVSHGDTLQILQTVVHAALASMSCAGDGTLGSHLAGAVCTSVLSQHREYSLLTGELRLLA